MKIVQLCKKAAKAVWIWWDGLPAPEQKKLIRQAEQAAKKLRRKD